MDIGEPQCAQAESVARLIAAPQLEQFTVSAQTGWSVWLPSCFTIPQGSKDF
jgi:hypothetical protein